MQFTGWAKAEFLDSMGGECELHLPVMRPRQSDPNRGFSPLSAGLQCASG